MYPRPTDAELPAFLRAYMDHVPDGDVLAMLAEQGRLVVAEAQRHRADVQPRIKVVGVSCHRTAELWPHISIIVSPLTFPGDTEGLAGESPTEEVNGSDS